MKHVFIFFFCTLTFNLGFSQCDVALTTHQDQDFFRSTNLVNYVSNQSPQNFGNVAVAQFQTVRVTLNGNSTIASARYNPMSGDLQIKKDDKIYNIVKTNSLEIAFVDSNKIFKAISYINDAGETSIDYFVFDANAPNSDLLIKVDYKYVAPQLARNSYSVNKPARYVELDNFYVMDHANRLVSLSTKKKSILKAFPKTSKLILAYIKENKIKNKEEGLMLLANYISNLEIDTNSGTLLASNKP